MKKSAYVLVLVLLTACATATKSYYAILEPGTTSTDLRIFAPKIRDAPSIAFFSERSAEVSFYTASVIYGCPDFKRNKKGYIYTQKLTKNLWQSSVKIPADKYVYVLLGNKWNNSTFYSAFKFKPDSGTDYELEIYSEKGLGGGREFKLSSKASDPDKGEEIKVEPLELSHNFLGGGDAYYIKQSACID